MTKKKTKERTIEPSLKIGVSFKINEDGTVRFCNPFSDDIPITLGCLVLKKIGEAEREYNQLIKDKKL